MATAQPKAPQHRLPPGAPVPEAQTKAGIPGHTLVYEIRGTCTVISRGKRKIVFQGNGAWTDNKTISLPAIASTAVYDTYTARVMRGYANHEAGHCRYTDFERLGVEMEAIKQIAPHPTKERAVQAIYKVLTNIFEDKRLEAMIMAEYPGTPRDNLAAVRDYVTKRRHKSATADLQALYDPAKRAATLKRYGVMNVLYDAFVQICTISNAYPCAGQCAQIVELLREIDPATVALCEGYRAQIDALTTEDDVYGLSRAIIEELIDLANQPALSGPPPDADQAPGNPLRKPEEDQDSSPKSDKSQDPRESDGDPSDQSGPSGSPPPQKSEDDKAGDDGEGEAGSGADESGDPQQGGAEDESNDDSGGGDSDQDAGSADQEDREPASGSDDDGVDKGDSGQDEPRPGDSQSESDEGEESDADEPEGGQSGDGEGDGEGGDADSDDAGDAGGEDQAGDAGDPQDEADQGDSGDASDPGEGSEGDGDGADGDGQGGDEGEGDQGSGDADGDGDGQGDSDSEESAGEGGQQGSGKPGGNGAGQGQGGDSTGDPGDGPAQDDGDGNGISGNDLTQALDEPLPGEDEGNIDVSDLMKEIAKMTKAMAKAISKQHGQDAAPTEVTGIRHAQVEATGASAASVKAHPQISSAIRTIVIAQSKVRTNRNREEGVFDRKAIVPQAIGRTDVYKRVIRSKAIDTAWLTLIDKSGSMGHCIGAAGDIAAATAESAFAFPTLKTAIHSYTSEGPQFDQLLMQGIKEFDEPMVRARSRYNAWREVADEDMGGTPTGHAMLEGVRMLDLRREEKKVMLVVTDGVPDCFDLTMSAHGLAKARGIVTCLIEIGGHPQPRLPFDVAIVARGLEDLPQAMIEIARKTIGAKLS